MESECEGKGTTYLCFFFHGSFDKTIKIIGRQPRTLLPALFRKGFRERYDIQDVHFLVLSRLLEQAQWELRLSEHKRVRISFGLGKFIAELLQRRLINCSCVSEPTSVWGNSCAMVCVARHERAGNELALLVANGFG